MEFMPAFGTLQQTHVYFINLFPLLKAFTKITNLCKTLRQIATLFVIQNLLSGSCTLMQEEKKYKKYLE
jgi:hypothetical protein